MDFQLDEELLAMQEVAREFAENEIAPNIEQDEKEHRFRPEIVKKMADLGFFGCVIPEEYGGNGAGHLASMVVTEEIARVSASWGLPFNVQTMGPALTILRWGTEEQKHKYIKPLVDADLFGCFAITEPDTGSDVASMKTYAVKTDEGYVFNGSKTWISSAHVADVAVVFAYTDREAQPRHRGMSAFVVDLKNNPGITTAPIETKLGLFCAPTGSIAFEDAVVPHDALLGKEGEGFKICMSMLDCTRLSSAVRAVGVARGALEESVKYAQEREQFGKPIASFQMIQEQLAQMKVEEDAARLLVWRAAVKRDRGERNSLEVSIAKYYAAEAAVHAANTAVKIFGSYGFSSEYPVERYLRDSKSFQIVEGTSNIQKVIISSYLLGKKK